MTQFALQLLVIALLAAPFAAAGRFGGVYPRPALALLALLPAATSLAVLVSPAATLVVLAMDIALVGVAAFDALSLPSRKTIQLERRIGRAASLQKPHRAELRVANASAAALRVWLRDLVPAELDARPEEFSLALAPRSRTSLHYELRPVRRGAFRIPGVHVRAASRLGLWQCLFVAPLPATVNVYPDMQQLSEYALLARTNRLSLLGVRRTRRTGTENEFERLRDFSPDDNFKHIDWRATARRQKLIVRDFQASQSQRILFLVDSGRMMTNEAAGLSLLDHAFNATLMLSYVALRQGDTVGLITFSDEIHEYVPPRSGMRQMNRLLHACYDRFPRLVESRYDAAFRYLAVKSRKRSLVVLITSVIDEINAHQIERYLANLVGRHLPLGVLLRDRTMFQAVEPENPTPDELWPAAAAAEILAWRHQVLSDLARKGVLTLDVFPEQMTAPIINRYLEIKARQLL